MSDSKATCLSSNWKKKKKTWPAQRALIQVSKTCRKNSDQKISISNCAEKA